jgi:tetratricopeptide (TPR) repeat protein
MAQQGYANAINVYTEAGDGNKVAETNLKIGEVYENILDQVTEEDKATTEPVSEEPQKPEERRQTQNRKEHEDRLRRSAADYFRGASDENDKLGIPDKAAEMLLRAGGVLSGSKRLTLKNEAAETFINAAQKYKKANDRAKETSALISAGDVFLKAEDKELWPRADKYYEQAVSIYRDAGLKKEEAQALGSVGESYGSSDDPGQKRKGAGYHQRTADIYAETLDKPGEVSALLAAAALWQEIEGEEAQRQAAAYYDKAVAVYENDVPKQVSTLTRIARSLARPTSEARAAVAERYLQKAIALAERQSDKEIAASAYIDIGSAFQSLRKIPLAISNFEHSRSIYAQTQNKPGEVGAFLAAAALWQEIEGEEAQRQAAAYYDKAVAVYENDVPQQVSTLTRIARSLARPNSEARAAVSERYLQKAVALAEQQSDKKVAASAYIDIGSAYQSLRKLPLAISNFERARSLYAEISDSFGQGIALYRLTSAHRVNSATRAQASETAHRSLDLLAQSLPGLAASGDRKSLADGHYAMGYLYSVKKDYARALASYTNAFELYQSIPQYQSVPEQRTRMSLTRSNIARLRKQLGQPQ